VKYYSFTFPLEKSWQQEILIAKLDAIGFEGFEEKQGELIAFISAVTFNEKEFLMLLESMQPLFSIAYVKTEIAEQNWNLVWESNFQPIIISNDLAVRASFHSPFPLVKHEIIIDPKMSFGTGHHATTSMMLELMLLENLENKKVLDFGSGTGILSILAAKLGASSVVAIDNEEWACRNSVENFHLNNVSSATSELGDASTFKGKKYDVILANINRMVIINTMVQFSESLQYHGLLVISGFLQEDEEMVVVAARSSGFKISKKMEQDGWMAMRLNHVNEE